MNIQLFSTGNIQIDVRYIFCSLYKFNCLCCDTFHRIRGTIRYLQNSVRSFSLTGGFWLIPKLRSAK